MFYLAELIDRLFKTVDPTWLDFSYQDVVDKMMEKRPENRYATFADAKVAIGKHDFINMEISDEDKKTYRSFIDLVYQSLAYFIDERIFISDPEGFLSSLEKVIRDNLFEENVQKNSAIISCLVTGSYRYKEKVNIPLSVVKEFVAWFKSSTSQSQKLILANIVHKLSAIDIKESNLDIPF